MFSLFATLFVRLYYLQVVSGEKYQGKAAAQSVRDIVVQPQRGLIVDAMGRPLVANRMSWVVSIDRTLLGDLTERQQRRLVERVAHTLDVPPRIRRKLLTAVTRAQARRLLERLAVPAGPRGRGRRPGRRAEDPRAAGGLSRRAGATSRPSGPTRTRSESTPPTSSAT